MCLRQACLRRCSSALSPVPPLGTTHPNSGSFNASQEQQAFRRPCLLCLRQALLWKCSFALVSCVPPWNDTSQQWPLQHKPRSTSVPSVLSPVFPTGASLKVFLSPCLLLCLPLEGHIPRAVAPFTQGAQDLHLFQHVLSSSKFSVPKSPLRSPRRLVHSHLLYKCILCIVNCELEYIITERREVRHVEVSWTDLCVTFQVSRIAARKVVKNQKEF